VTVESIACGGKHVACIDSTGKLWTWGGNEGGCLGLGDAQRRAAPAPVPSSAELGLQQAVCGYSHTVLVSKFEASQVQSRAFFDPIENQFCLYPWGQESRYYPLSVLRAFIDKHGVPLSPLPVIVIDPPNDERLSQVLQRLQAIAVQCPTVPERVRALALAVYYEMGGAHAALNEVSAKHMALLVERQGLQNGAVPIGSIRVGDSRVRAALFKLACDRLGVPCSLVRGAVPDVDVSSGFFDLSLCSSDPGYANNHHWNIVKLEGDECFMVDTVGLPTDLRAVENSANLLQQLGDADRNAP